MGVVLAGPFFLAMHDQPGLIVGGIPVSKKILVRRAQAEAFRGGILDGKKLLLRPQKFRQLEISREEKWA
jgi:hypothetical protein